MGSSVTAGHDSPFNKSFPVLTGNVMGPAFEAAGLKLVTRNAAMGNNPCLPYDVCVRPFAGRDADIVHWEQVSLHKGRDLSSCIKIIHPHHLAFFSFVGRVTIVSEVMVTKSSYSSSS